MSATRELLARPATETHAKRVWRLIHSALRVHVLAVKLAARTPAISIAKEQKITGPDQGDGVVDEVADEADDVRFNLAPFPAEMG